MRYLTPEEVALLTGYRRPGHQYREMERLGYPIERRRRDGFPIVRADRDHAGSTKRRKLNPL